MLLLAAAVGAGILPGPAVAQVFMTQEEALAQAFSGARVERHTAFLSAEQLRAAQGLAGSEAPIEQTVVTYYVAFEGQRPVGAAYFDVHRVRTREEVLMIVVSPQATIQAIEILRWAEPPEYMAPPPWLRQLPGRRLDGNLSVRGAIAGITGATLTARAVTGAARRTLALHQVISPFDEPGGSGGGPAGPGGRRR